MSFSRRLEGLTEDPPKIMCIAPSSPRNAAPPPAVVIVGGLASRLVLHLRLENTLDVVLHEPALPERVLDGNLMVRAQPIQEPLEVVSSRCELGRVALRARRLALYRRDKVVVAAALVILLLFEREDVPSPWSMTCFPLP
jgi:hypothetical protein